MINKCSCSFTQQTFIRGLWCQVVWRTGHTTTVPAMIAGHTVGGAGVGRHWSLLCVVLEGFRELGWVWEAVGKWLRLGSQFSIITTACLKPPVPSGVSSAFLPHPWWVKNRDSPRQLYFVCLILFLAPVCIPGCLPPSLTHALEGSLRPLLLGSML